MSQHHSFDIKLAAIYGVEEAILIHHFQHWIRFNAFKEKNFKDGHTWSYQSRVDIQGHFPYWNYDRVKYLCEKLVEMKVLITANYNKMSIDKTLWYAFADEKLFGVDLESSKSFYEGQKCPTKGKSALPLGKSAQPIPDTKTTDTKTQITKDRKEAPKGPRPSADAEALSNLFFNKIKERSPGFKPPNLEKWAREMDCLLRIDNRDATDVESVILWAAEHKWWKIACLCPSKLRKEFDRMLLQKESEQDKDRIRDNRNFAVSMKDKYPDKLKGLTFDDKYVMNRATGKELPFNLPEENFEKEFKALFGAR